MLCEIALVLLLDASASLDQQDWWQQVEQTAAAIRSEEVSQAILRTGSVAITAAAFADHTQTMIGWRVLQTQEDIHRFAADLVAQRRPFSGGTQIGDALKWSIGAIATSPCSEIGQAVTDISTDGDAQMGETEEARDQAQMEGIRINAIAVGSAVRPENLRNFTITYDGFLLEVNNWDDYPRMFRRKIIMELTGGY